MNDPNDKTKRDLNWKDVPVPPRLAKRPTDSRGYPITFVTQFNDGEPDFTVVAGDRISDCVRFDLCGLCGQHLGKFRSFIGGPKSTESGMYVDPPMHTDCAEYALLVCPHLATPTARYKKQNLKEGEISIPLVSENRPDEFFLLTATRVKLTTMGDTVVFCADVETSTVCRVASGRTAKRSVEQ